MCTEKLSAISLI